MKQKEKNSGWFHKLYPTKKQLGFYNYLYKNVVKLIIEKKMYKYKSMYIENKKYVVLI